MIQAPQSERRDLSPVPPPPADGGYEPVCDLRLWTPPSVRLRAVMVRHLTLAALLIAVAFGGSIASGTLSSAQAKKYHRAMVCRHVKLNGKVRRWRCRSGQLCCSAEIGGYYGCGSKYLGRINPGLNRHSPRDLLVRHRRPARAAVGRACGCGRASLPGRSSAAGPVGGFAAERLQDSDGREAGTSAVRSRRHHRSMMPPDLNSSVHARTRAALCVHA